MKIVLGGPRRSGKSCLRERLKIALRESAGLYAYALTVNPDGEGAWFQETAQADRELAQRLKAISKGKWTEEHVRVYAEWVRCCTHPLTLIDVGGKTDDKNETICKTATHAILIAPTEAAFEPWRAFCEKLGLAIVSEIVSDYNGHEDRVEDIGPDQVLRGVVHHLERGELAGQRPMIDALADYVVQLSRLACR